MKVATRLFASMPSWQSPVVTAALAGAVFVWGTGSLGREFAGAAREGVGEERAALVIGADPDSKRADRDAKRAAREAKKKARAEKAEERAMAKAKSGKRSSNSSANLGDNDPLEGL